MDTVPAYVDWRACTVSPLSGLNWHKVHLKLPAGLATEFRFEKIPRNRLEMASVIPRKKVLILRHSEVYGTIGSEARNGRKWHEKNLFKNPAPANRIDSMFLSQTCFGTEFREFASFFFQGTEFRAFSPLRNNLERNYESFLSRRMVQNWILRDCFYFCSMVQNSEHSSPLRNGSERNSDSFLFRGTVWLPPEQTNCSVYYVFRGIIFCRKLPTLLPALVLQVIKPKRTEEEQWHKTSLWCCY
jgi:hypothetical protein